MPVQLTVALTSYLGVSGTDLGSRDGVLYAERRVLRLTDITDGSSNTLLVGERPPGADLAYGWWYAGPGQDLTGSGDVTLGVRERNVALPGACPDGPYQLAGRLTEQCDLFHFWSPHAGGANFLLADGSVRFLRLPRGRHPRGPGDAAGAQNAPDRLNDPPEGEQKTCGPPPPWRVALLAGLGCALPHPDWLWHTPHAPHAQRGDPEDVI